MYKRQVYNTYTIYPAYGYVTKKEQILKACDTITAELENRLETFKAETKLLEHERLEQRTRHDVEMLREVGMCPGIENYSRHIDCLLYTSNICDHVVFNSFNQWQKYQNLAKQTSTSCGIRINPECSTQIGHEIYDPCAKFSRMGVTLENFKDCLLYTSYIKQ